MKQILQSYRTGELKVAEVPIPFLAPGYVLVQTECSAVSLGTEGRKVVTARQSLIGKARSRPDLFRQVIRSAQREGVLATYRKVMNRLDEPLSLGYSAAGTVIGLGSGVHEFRVGDRVACGGEEAAHAEVMAVPVNLCCGVLDGVDMEHAAFATIGAIALQGVRQARVTLGECVVVIGLGLVGQLAVQLLKANGCRVVGIDLDPKKVMLAGSMGADKVLSRGSDNLDAAVSSVNGGFGADAVLITAAASSNDPIELAVRLCRDRARIVVVGGVKMDVPRDACYHKELDFRLSRSYGPGRYDPSYEEKGVDYPIGYVRWTEKRNMEAFLQLLAAGKINIGGLITHRFSLDQAEEAYALLAGKSPGSERPLGLVFRYDAPQDFGDATNQRVWARQASWSAEFPARSDSSNVHSTIGVGFVGAGSFARKFLIPPIAECDNTRMVGVATATGTSAQNTAQKFGFAYSTTDYRQVIEDPNIQAVLVATRHNLHSKLVAEALAAHKSVFVEKPLALSHEQLDSVVAAYRQSESSNSHLPRLMVGFNRRFAPFAREARQFFDGRAEPMVVQYRVNAGYVESTHWYQDPEQGGGRIIGEACHFIDFIAYLVGAEIRTVYAAAMNNIGRYNDDNVLITLTFADGSVGNVCYMANGDDGITKERIEIHCQSSSAMIDDFSHLELYRRGKRKVKKMKQDKGHRAEVTAFLDSLRENQPAPVPFGEYVSSSSITLAAMDSLALGLPLVFDGSKWRVRTGPWEALEE